MGGIVQSFLESWALIKFYICSVVKFKICHYKACVVGVCSCVWWSTTEIQLYTSPLTLRFPLKSLWSGLFPNNWSHILHLPGLVFRKSRFSFVACSLTPASPAPLPAPQCLSLLFSFLPGEIRERSKPWLRSGERFSVPANQEQWEATCARAMGNRKLECHKEEGNLCSPPTPGSRKDFQEKPEL